MRKGYRVIINLWVLIAQTALFNFYMYELFYGNWENRSAKALYYSVTAFVLIYLVIDDWIGYVNNRHKELNIICKLSLVINFISFALILYDVMPDAFLNLLIFNGTIFAISTIILVNGTRYGTFNQYYEDDQPK